MILQVLDYYVSKGVVDVTPYSLPGYQPNLPLLDNMYLVNRDYFNRQNEIIPLNDCLYRNMYKYVLYGSFSNEKEKSPYELQWHSRQMSPITNKQEPA